jgi:hypothetical protein
MATPIQLATYGKLTTASDPKAPLIIVFGGVDVGGRTSGKYMYDYFNALLTKYHVFVAANPSVHGLHSYDAVVHKLTDLKVSPAYQILYLFSGGYNPGKAVLNKYGVRQFEMIYLVDIWMKNDSYYPNIVDTSPSSYKYFYTEFAANNAGARDHIAKKVSSKLIAGSSMADHLSTNKAAVADLIANY